MKKTRAFTLTELIVVMIISTIVVSLAFTALSMVKKQIRIIEKRLYLKEELVQLEKILTRDFNTFRTITFNSDIVKFSHALDSVTYKIEDTFVLRNKDSIQLSLKNTSLFLNGVKVAKGNVDAIRFEIGELNNRPTFIYTEKDAAFYLNN
ncbi:type II secretion system protein [uncultured Tenacibaculum sp.]|uniref:PulJ/GspJ family protein n=1 Tax=uncultured Tenacibaculum sp. TaxID=174713 RepID=UPI0026097723|nr:type II secretion system protein [uncultured Tenacibaculum sp.]